MRWVAAAGDRVLFGSLRDPTNALDVDLFVKSVSGRAAPEVLVDSGGSAFSIANDWSPDERHVVFTDYDGLNVGNLMLASVETGEIQPILEREFTDRVGFFSPDGRWLGYVSDESGRDEIYITSFPEFNGKWQISAQGVRVGGNAPRAARWRGNEIVYRAVDGRMMSTSVEIVDEAPRIGTPGVLFDESRINGRDLSADGQQFLVLLGERGAGDTPLTVIQNWTAGR